jgi:hypothetical protein
MVELAQSKGLASEKKMWESVADLDALLCVVKKEHPDMYWDFIRKQHSILFNGHYSEEFAEHDVKMIWYKDKNGEEQHGAHWTKDQIINATKGMSFPPNTNDCDKYVAFNVMYADLCKVLTDEQIIQVAYAFFFADDDFDYSVESKIWHYMI